MDPVHPWRLGRCLGRGGMGEVWEAVHEGTSTRAALKRVCSPRDESFLSAFRNEVRAVAALDHRNVVGVLDHGTDAGGAPYLVLELCEGGSLTDVGRVELERGQQLLLDVLAGLAHAHARGVIHRDLKPANVLLDRDDTARIADFGIAWLVNAEPEAGGVSAGTPSYTAFEQLTGSWRDLGPWTDLYAVGCLAWRLFTGAPPYEIRGWAQALLAHGRHPVPRLPPELDLPVGLEDWLRRMLAKAPGDRFQRAADAARALVALTGDNVPAPLPASWEVERPEVTRPPGVGLGLWGLRALPVVGRHAERDALWGALREVHVDRRPVAVLLRGPAGTGKSRLARWLAQRAHEEGAAEVVHAVHDPAGGPGSGLNAPDEARSDSAAERRGAVLRWLAERSSARPLVLWIDDVQWGLEALSVARALLAEARAAVLVVLTARDDALADAPEARAALGALPGLRTVPLAPLGPQDHHVLVRELGLAGELAARVERRTAGNPLFAVHLVGDWVARGVLEPTEGGLRLRDGARAELPEDLAALWRGPLSRVLEAVPEAEAGLELAALLGLRVDPGEWEFACEEAGVEPPWVAVEAMLDAGLATAAPGGPRNGWSFVHGMLREALASGAGPERHDACARMLARDGRDPIRRGLHLVAAGRDADALEPLLLGVEQRSGDEDYRLALEPLSVREAALRRLGVPETDARWGEGRLTRARIQRLSGDWRGAHEALTALADDADAHAWRLLRTRARADLALVLRGLGRSAEAVPVLREARALAGDDAYQQATLDMRLCLALQDLGELDEGCRVGRDAARVFDALARPVMAAHVRIALAMGMTSTGHLDGAVALATRARDDYAAADSRAGVANAENTIAEALRLAGDLDGAAAGYERSLRLYASMHSGHAVLPRVNLGLTLLEQGRDAEAKPILDEGAAELARQGRRTLQVVAEVGRLAARARLGEHGEIEPILGVVEDLLRQTSAHDVDLGRWARVAAQALSGPTSDRCRAIAAGQP